jgi:MoxR-like ATPase
MRIRMGYPGRRAEIDILERHGTSATVADDLGAVATTRDVNAMVSVAQAVHVAGSLKGYMVDLAEATREHKDLALGVSPRATLALLRAARAWAAARGRDYVVPDDLKDLAVPVLEHRLALTPEAQLRGVTAAEVLDDVLRTVPVPSGRGG